MIAVPVEQYGLNPHVSRAVNVRRQLVTHMNCITCLDVRSAQGLTEDWRMRFFHSDLAGRNNQIEVGSKSHTFCKLVARGVHVGDESERESLLLQEVHRREHVIETGHLVWDLPDRSPDLVRLLHRHFHAAAFENSTFVFGKELVPLNGAQGTHRLNCILLGHEGVGQCVASENTLWSDFNPELRARLRLYLKSVRLEAGESSVKVEEDGLDHGRRIIAQEFRLTIRLVGKVQAGKLPIDVLGRLLARVEITDPRVVLGPQAGEDAALIDFGDRYLVAKTDPITFATDLIGWYMVNVNANDIAVMGATPEWLLATLLLPEGTDEHKGLGDLSAAKPGMF